MSVWYYGRMIGISQSTLSLFDACHYDRTSGTIRDAAGAAKYLAAVSTTHPGWLQEWALASSGLACSYDTFALLKGARAIEDPGYLDGCFVSASRKARQLTVDAGAALPGDPPPPPPP
jgi:hypothetical protein